MASENLNEKVSVNINTSTLSAIDLLVDNGYYSNRSDFINQALRREVEQQQPVIQRIMDQNVRTAPKHHQWFLGLFGLEEGTVREMYLQGKTMTIRGYGVLNISQRIQPDMLYKVVEHIAVRGRVAAPEEIKRHYGLK